MALQDRRIRLGVIDTESSGHHTNYLHLVAMEAIAEGLSPVLFIERCAAERLASSWTPDLVGQVKIVQFDLPPRAIANGPVKGLVSQFLHWRTLRQIYRTHIREQRCDLLYAINLDPMEKALSALGSPFSNIPLAGMLMRVRFHHSACGILSPRGIREVIDELSFCRILRIPQLRCMMTIDECLPDYCVSRCYDEMGKIVYTPDVAHGSLSFDRTLARERYGISPESKVFLAYGVMSHRKALDVLLAALGRVETENVVLLVVGECDAAGRAHLATPAAQQLRQQGRIFEALAFQDQRGEAAAFAAADFVWLGYREFYQMSGVLVQAAQHGLPVIATESGLIGYYSRKYRLGPSVNVKEPSSVSTAIESLISGRGCEPYDVEGISRFAHEHSVNSFSVAMRAGLRRALRSVLPA